MTLLALRDGGGDDDGGERYVAFRAGGGWYGLRVLDVREIARLPPVTEVPGAGEGVRGVVLVHGAVLTLVDLARALGEEPAPGAAPRCLVVEHEGEALALAVDEVARIQLVAPAQVEPAEEIPGRLAAHVTGVARLPGRDGPEGFLVLLDLGAVLRAALPLA